MAEQVKRQKGRLALFKLNNPARLGFPPRPANALPIGCGNFYEGDKTVMIGYHRPLSTRYYLYCPWPCFLHAEAAVARVNWGNWAMEGCEPRLRFSYRSGMGGSPIFSREAVVGLALHFNYDTKNDMAVAYLPEVRDFLQGELLGDFANSHQSVSTKPPVEAEV